MFMSSSSSSEITAWFVHAFNLHISVHLKLLTKHAQVGSSYFLEHLHDSNCNTASGAGSTSNQSMERESSPSAVSKHQP